MAGDRPVSASRWRRVPRLVVAATLLALFSLPALVLWSVRRSSSATNGSLTVRESALDVGEVWEDSGFRWDLPITNNSSVDVEILDIKAQCGCLSVESVPLLVGAGQTEGLRLVLDLTRIAPDRGEISPQPFALKMSPVIKSRPRGERVWELNGRVRRVFPGLPTSIDFGESCVRGRRFPARELQAVSQIGIKSLTAESASSAATCEVARSSDDRRTFTIQITPSEQLPLGPFEFAVRLVAVADTNESLPPVTMQAFGRVVHDVAVDAPVILGALRVGETAERPMRVWSHSGKTFEIAAIDCDDGKAEVEAESDAASSEKQLKVIVRNAQQGAQQFTVRLKVREEEGLLYELAVPVLYHGYRDEAAQGLPGRK